MVFWLVQFVFLFVLVFVSMYCAIYFSSVVLFNLPLLHLKLFIFTVPVNLVFKKRVVDFVIQKLVNLLPTDPVYHTQSQLTPQWVVVTPQHCHQAWCGQIISAHQSIRGWDY